MKGKGAPSVAPTSFSSTTMRVRVLIAVHVALLVATAGTELEDLSIWLSKCCDVYQMLSADGESCVEADWPSNSSITKDENGFIVPPLDSEWTRRWLPPGLPKGNIRKVITLSRDNGNMVSAVNASSWMDPALLANEILLRNTVAFSGEYYVAWPRPGGRIREAHYCVDAALPPLGPFAMRFRTKCNNEECAYKCCWNGLLIDPNKGYTECEGDAEGFWKPSKSSLTVFDPEFPYRDYDLCKDPRLLPFEEQYADWARHTHGSKQFHFSSWDTCFEFNSSISSSNGSLHERLFYCEFSRIARGVYWLLRPLCFLSTLLLTVSLMSILFNHSMRRKIHGRCLASHAASLLAFNIGQTVYYIALSDYLDEEGKDYTPSDLQDVCKYFALSMYFVLTAAWMWLTALCVNMARGFRLQMQRFNTGNGKRFLAISAIAWGLSALLTMTSSILFTQPKWRETPAWYNPSLMETRTCYIEPLSEFEVYGVSSPFLKSGTALFYYGPMCCLVFCNVICLAFTLRKVHYLKRGNSVLRREEDQIPLGQRHTEENNPPMAHSATGNVHSRKATNRYGTTVDTKTACNIENNSTHSLHHPPSPAPHMQWGTQHHPHHTNTHHD